MVAPRHDRVANPRAPTPEFAAIFPPSCRQPGAKYRKSRAKRAAKAFFPLFFGL